MIKEITTELTDIFEDITVKNHKKVLKSNIEYILKREGLLPKGSSVCLCVGSTMLTENYAHAYFSVFGRDMNTVLFEGCAYGSVCDATNELMELTLETEVDTKFLQPKTWRCS